MSLVFEKLRDAITFDVRFQTACARYHHHGGSSAAIAAAALRAIGEGENQASCGKVIVEIRAERGRQITAEGYDVDHDDAHEYHELARAACVLALYASLPNLDREMATRNGPLLYGSEVIWPWPDFKLASRRRDLIKAAALIVAEIERLDRADAAEA